jgi:hypothetical protein
MNSNNSRIEDLEDIIKILINILENNNVSKDNIKFELRKYHYCFDCNNHFRGCKCGEEDVKSEYESCSISIDDNYTSSEYSSSDEEKE